MEKKTRKNSSASSAQVIEELRGIRMLMRLNLECHIAELHSRGVLCRDQVDEFHGYLDVHDSSNAENIVKRMQKNG